MSKYDLRSKTHSLSGVTYKQSLLASSTSLTSPPLLERIGGIHRFHTLTTLFYKQVLADKASPWFLGIFATSTSSEAIDNQYRILVQTFGGPELCKEKKGKYTWLVGRHAIKKLGCWWQNDGCTISNEQLMNTRHWKKMRRPGIIWRCTFRLQPFILLRRVNTSSTEWGDAFGWWEGMVILVISDVWRNMSVDDEQSFLKIRICTEREGIFGCYKYCDNMWGNSDRLLK